MFRVVFWLLQEVSCSMRVSEFPSVSFYANDDLSICAFPGFGLYLFVLFPGLVSFYSSSEYSVFK